MSAILAAFGEAEPLRDDRIHTMLDAMRVRGRDHVETWRDSTATIAVARHAWELEPAFSGNTLIVRDDRFVVAADAALFYHDDLRRRLRARSVAPAGETPAHLILAALHAFDTEASHFLEGDFAFVAWDRLQQRAIASRDFGGKRPLYYADLPAGIIFASSIGALLRHPRCPTDLDPVHLAGTAAGLFFSAGPGTPFSHVHTLPAAHDVTWQNGTLHTPSRNFDPARFATTSTTPHDAAAEHLSHLLREATAERMPVDDATAVWMSGGWDSTSVFAAAQQAARLDPRLHPPHAVSISYPEGDPGREDELINQVAEFWNTPVRWIDIDDIPLLDRPAETAGLRDQPFAHLYEHWNRALARAARASGARVALDGNGGDQLFQNTDIFLADLARSGRWITLAREWRARPRAGFRAFFRWAIQPNLPPFALRAARTLRRGRRLRHYLERHIPAWIDRDFARRHDLAGRDAPFLGRPGFPSHTTREMDWFLGNPFITRAFALLGEYALDADIELRSPLTDRRIIEFAFSRPWWERSSGTETKRLLRAAMKGALPRTVLAPRTHRTGITSGYSHRWMRNRFPTLFEHTTRKPLILEELGIINGTALRAAARDYPTSGDAWVRVNLFYTLQTELWLRARDSASRSFAPPPLETVAGMMQWLSPPGGTRLPPGRASCP